MNKHFSPFLLVFLVFIGCNTEDRINSKSKTADNPSYPSDIETKIEKVKNNLQVETAINGVYDTKSLAEQMEYYHTPGVSIAVINDGKIEWARGFGKRDLEENTPVDIHTLFEAGSVSKPVFALAVMHLKQEGILELDKDVSEYLKSWKVPKRGNWQPKITLRQLLSHTAGLTVHGFPGYLNTEPVPTIPEILDGSPPANTPAVLVNILPGTDFRYSGGGVTVAQLTVMDILNQPFPEILKKELFNPLKLTYSTYQQPLPSKFKSIASTAYPYKSIPIKGRFHIYPEMAAAGLWTNPSELATILIEVQKSIKGESILFKKEIIEEMLTPQKVFEQVGIGFFLEGKGDSIRFGHGGWDEGFVTQATAYKNIGKGAVIMVNSNEGNPLLNEIMRSIAMFYDWPDYMPSQTNYIKMDKDKIKSYAGIYRDPKNNELIIKTLQDSAFLIYQNQDPIRLFQTTNMEFKNDQLNFSIVFKDDGLHFNQQGKSVLFKKINL
jgi:CubicO group peptidase (beta-lactamase class C family)